MEQPLDNSDGIQPQELSSPCSFPNGVELTKNGEECLLKVNPVEALHAVQPPSWFLSSATSNGMALPEDGLDPSQQPSDQIQPDNAPSNTTVTLSYVTRSPVLTGPDPLSQHSQIYSIPISKAFSLHPSLYDASQLVTDAAGASLCVDMDQSCLQQVSVPVGIASCGNQFDFATPGQIVENVTSFYFQQAHNLGGVPNVEGLSLDVLGSLQPNGLADCKFPVNLDEVQNGGLGSLWNAGSFNGGFPAGHVESTDDRHKNSSPELLFLISRADDPAMLQNDQGTAGLAVSLNREFISALEGTGLPSVAPLDGVEDVSVLPPITVSTENTLVEETSNTVEEELGNGDHEPLGSEQERDSSLVTDVSFSTGISPKPAMITDDASLTEQSGQGSNVAEGRKVERDRHRVTNKKSSLQGCLLAKNETLARKELPPRTTRGMRLEAIVQNIYPTRYKFNQFPSPPKCPRTNAQASEATNPIPDVSSDSTTHNDFLEEASPRKARTKPNNKASQLQEKEEETGVAELNRISTSCSKRVPNHSLTRTSSRKLHQPVKGVKKSKKQKNVSKKSRVRVKKQNALSIQKSSKKRTLRTLSKGAAKAKKVHTPKRKRKKHKMGQASIFSPKEPEIKLKCLTYNQEKREKRDETFSPFVCVDLAASPTYTLVNYPEECARLTRGKQQAQTVTGKLPETPGLQYGRVSTEGARQSVLVCRLCGGAANAMDLGDLHGPYYSEGFRPKERKTARAQESREGDSSDTDSSHVVAPSPGGFRTLKPRRKLQADGRGAYQRWTSDGDLSCSPAAKRPRTDGITDWYSPPVVPLEESEYWLHEDCGIWSAGVFLVRGKLYGLEEAVKMAKETICCSCHKSGASLGCFFKGCSNKYHYICAMQSGCVLYEENFSMKCKKHKDRSHLLFRRESDTPGDLAPD